MTVPVNNRDTSERSADRVRYVPVSVQHKVDSSSARARRANDDRGGRLPFREQAGANISKRAGTFKPTPPDESASNLPPRIIGVSTRAAYRAPYFTSVPPARDIYSSGDAIAVLIPRNAFENGA